MNEQNGYSPYTVAWRGAFRHRRRLGPALEALERAKGQEAQDFEAVSRLALEAAQIATSLSDSLLELHRQGHAAAGLLVELEEARGRSPDTA